MHSGWASERNTNSGRLSSAHGGAGFTIVELLIVIVVIAILAAISIVAFTGIQDRARSAAASATAKQVADKIALYALDNNSNAPATLGDIDFADDGDTTYQYRVSNTANPKTWCATVTVGSKSSFVSNAQRSPADGACAGHGVGGGAVVTNLSVNPRATRNNAGISSNNGGTWPVSYDVTVPATPDGITTAAEFRTAITTSPTIASIYNLDGRANTSGISRSISAWVRINAAGYSVTASTGFPETPLTPNTWTRVQTTVPTAGNAWSGMGISKLPGNGNAAAADRAWVTGVMSVEGSTNYAFRDGLSPGWIWDGAASASSSTGPIN